MSSKRMLSTVERLWPASGEVATGVSGADGPDAELHGSSVAGSADRGIRRDRYADGQHAAACA